MSRKLQAVAPDPGEDQADQARLLGHDLEAGHPAAPLAAGFS